MNPLAGGWSGRTFLSDVGGARSVVRIYPPDDSRGTAAPEVDAAVMQLVRGLVPVPDVLEVRRTDGTVPGLLVTAWCEGDNGESVVPEDAVRRRRLGESLGRTAGTLAGMPTLRAGTWTGPDLSIEPFGLTLPDWVAAHADRLAGWSAGQLRALEAVAAGADELLSSVGRTCVVHSDLNPKNVLVEDGGAVRWVLDWEFSHSGSPFTDLGNVLRFDRDHAYADAALASYVEVRGGDRDEVLELARSADLWALVELASRTGVNPVATRADVLLTEIARTGDVHAWPSGW